MNLHNKINANIIIFLLVICLTGCSFGSNLSNQEKEHRPHYSKPEDNKAFVDKDGDFEYKSQGWNGPKDYKIVIPQDDNNAKESALVLQTYFKKVCNIELEIITDEHQTIEKEILIGNTNRKESKIDLSESELEVSVSDQKLVFSAGHYITLDSAIKKYTRLPYKDGKTNVFKLDTDFVSTKLEGYEYVWGDEFEGNDIDLTKWDFVKKMEGSPSIEISYDKDVISVEDGRLKLHALHYFNAERQGTEFKVPYSVATEKKMNYVYGYVEIRARVPHLKGAWPSFWTQSTDYLSGTRNKDYLVEVDIFEVFGSTNKVIPNLHKWYSSDYDYGKKHLGESTGAYHTTWGELEDNKDIWVWENENNVSNEYHTFGYEWTPTEYSMYVDGTKYMSFDITKSYDKSTDTTGYHDPQFLMFNNHVFTEDSTSIGSLIKDSIDLMPTCYYIDYCRVYQKKDLGKLYVDKKVNVYSDRN